jgi:phosphate/sulfate permease
MHSDQKPSVLAILLPVGFLFLCTLTVGAIAFFITIWGVNIGHLDCGNQCSSAVAPYHSKDGLAQVLYWLFALLGAVPVVLTSRKTIKDDKAITLTVSAILALLAAGVTYLAYSYMLFAP